MQSNLFPKRLADIETALQCIHEQDCHGLCLVRKKLAMKFLQREANKHSVALEYPRGSDAQITEGLRRQRLAWRYATERIRGPDQLPTSKDLALIAQYLAPGERFHPETGFRLEAVRITDEPHQPPVPAMIPEEIAKMLWSMEEMTPLERAIYAHYHLCRIHPFADGNGRTARLVQNAILCGANYVPAAIYRNQRDLYIDILSDTHDKFYDGKTGYLHTFADLIGTTLLRTVKRSKEYPWV
jgi:hypothetical protein